MSDLYLEYGTIFDMLPANEIREVILSESWAACQIPAFSCQNRIEPRLVSSDR